MPSPFPGMDPFVESPRVWPNAHHSLITMLRDRLASQLRPLYFDGIEDRVYRTDIDDPGFSVIVPDVQLLEPQENCSSWTSSDLDEGGVAVEIAEPIVATTLIDEEIREPRIEIIDSQNRAVITVIEILSPSNKVLGSRGRESYLEKREQVLDSKTHLVEIDLLRGAGSMLPRGCRPGGDYFVHVSRAGQRPKGQLWEIKLHQRLPVIAIPLKKGEDDATLDLQELFTSVYDRAGFDLVINYREEPTPPFSEAHAKWAQQWLTKKGLR